MAGLELTVEVGLLGVELCSALGVCGHGSHSGGRTTFRLYELPPCAGVQVSGASRQLLIEGVCGCVRR